MKLARSQHGMTLLVALVLLIVMTLFVVSMVRLSNTNARVVGNMQAQKGIDAEAQQYLEIAINKFQFFDDAIQGVGAWSLSTTAAIDDATLWTNYKPTGATTAPAKLADAVAISRPQCLYYEPASGYSALSGVAPQDTYWALRATASDSKTGATTEVNQGIQMRLPAGNCK